MEDQGLTYLSEKNRFFYSFCRTKIHIEFLNFEILIFDETMFKTLMNFSKCFNTLTFECSSVLFFFCFVFSCISMYGHNSEVASTDASFIQAKVFMQIASIMYSLIILLCVQIVNKFFLVKK